MEGVFGFFAVFAIIFIAIFVILYLKEGKRSSRNSKSSNKYNRVRATKRKGQEGEDYVNKYLSSLLLKDEYLLKNILLPTKSGDKTEIDTILITHEGIFCIEIKNWVGHIEGNDNLEYWYQIYNDDTYKNKMHRNPVEQNFKHVEILKEALDGEYDVNNVVIFKDLKKGSRITSKYTFTLESFKKHINPLPVILNSEEIVDIYNELKYYEATEEELKTFRQGMAERYKDE